MKTSKSSFPEEIKSILYVFIGIAFIVGFIGIANNFGAMSFSDGFGFIGGLFAGIFGIVIGFSLDRLNDREKDKRIKVDFLKLIHEELLDIKKLTPPDIKSTGKIYILYTDVWDSVVSSGNICLLDSDQVLKLSRLYKHVKATTFEAEWFRRVWDEYQSIPDSEKDRKQNYVGKKLDALGVAQIKRLKELRIDIDAVLQEDWWN